MRLNQEIEELIEYEGDGPYISIIAPMKMVFPESRQNAIEMKTLTQRVDHTLQEGPYSADLNRQLMEQLAEVERNIDYKHTLCGIGLFIAPGFSKVVDIPFTPDEKVMVSSTSFEVRDLVRATNTLYRYWVLSVSQDPVRLFIGFDDELQEIHDEFFPARWSGLPKENEDASTNRTREHEKYEQAHVEDWLTGEVDEQVFDKIKYSKMPVLITGPKKLVSHLQKNGKIGPHIVKVIEGANSNKKLHEMKELVSPIVKDLIEQNKQDEKGRLEEAVGVNLYAKGLPEVWRSAKLGNVETLLVEEGYAEAGFLGGNELELETNLQKQPNSEQLLEDAVDDVIEEVLQKRGKVVFLPEGMLADHKRIALIKRYPENNS